MGLNINNEVSWSYSGFNSFRAVLASEEGFRLHDMEGWFGDRPWSTVTTALKPLYTQQDDSGYLKSEDCGRMHARLRELVETAFGYDDPDRERGFLLADAMQRSAEEGHTLNFF